MKKPKLKITYRPPADIKPTEGNPRTHTDAQVEQIVASIQEFGFTNPILIDERDEIIAGHGRVLAAAKLELETVPTILLAHLTAEQRRAYVIADNKLALNAGWDADLLSLDIAALISADFDVGLTGFSEQELVPYIGNVEGTEFPELSAADREHFQRMAFVLHDDQVELVKHAITQAKKLGAFEGLNENKNGNSLARICEKFLEQNA